MKRLLNKKGETIVETLVAILIVAVCFLMLQNSIVTAARINNSTSNENKQINIDESTSTSCKLNIVRGSQISSYDYNCYKSGDYYYYE